MRRHGTEQHDEPFDVARERMGESSGKRVGETVRQIALRRCVVDAQHLQREIAHGSLNHCLAVVVIAHRLCKQRKALFASVEEELHRVDVELERQCLEKRHIVSQKVFVVSEINLMMRNQVVDAIV